MSPFLDCDEHDIGYAHYAAEQGEQADDPKCCLEYRDGFLHLHVGSEPVVDPDSAFVIRSRTV